MSDTRPIYTGKGPVFVPMIREPLPPGWRIKELEEALVDPTTPPQQIINIQAILKEYKEGRVPNELYQDGKPIHREQLDSSRHAWLEGPAWQIINRTHTTIYNDQLHGIENHSHPLFLQVRAKPSETNHHPDPKRYMKTQVMNDTGSTRFTLYKDELDFLGISDEDLRLLPPTSIMTATGQVGPVPQIAVECLLHDWGTGSPVRNWWTEYAIVWPHFRPGIPRLTGSGFREALHCATAPERPGRLFVTTTKTALANQMPSQAQCTFDQSLPP